MARSKKTRKPKSTKQKAYTKKAISLVTGLVVTWTDKNPEIDSAEVAGGDVEHRNPVYRPIRWQIWADSKKWVRTEVALLWKIKINCVFTYDNVDQHEERLVVAKGKLAEIAYEINDIITSAMRHGANLKEVRFSCECLGTRAATEEDWEDYE